MHYADFFCSNECMQNVTSHRDDYALFEDVVAEASRDMLYSLTLDILGHNVALPFPLADTEYRNVLFTRQPRHSLGFPLPGLMLARQAQSAVLKDEHTVPTRDVSPPPDHCLSSANLLFKGEPLVDAESLLPQAVAFETRHG